MKRYTRLLTNFWPLAAMIICFKLSFAFSANAQSESDYAALQELLGTERYQKLAEKRAHALPAIAYANRHGWLLSTTGDKDFSDYPSVSQLEPVLPNLGLVNVTELENGTWNMVGYNVSPHEKNNQYYRLDGRDKVLVILPTTLVRQKMLQDHE